MGFVRVWIVVWYFSWLGGVVCFFYFIGWVGDSVGGLLFVFVE